MRSLWLITPWVVRGSPVRGRVELCFPWLVLARPVLCSPFTWIWSDPFVGGFPPQRKEEYQFLITSHCINIFPPWNHRPAGAPVGGNTAGTHPSPADRVRCRRPHTIAEFSAEPQARANTIHAYTGATRPPPVGGNAQSPQAETSRRPETWRHLVGAWSLVQRISGRPVSRHLPKVQTSDRSLPDTI